MIQKTSEQGKEKVTSFRGNAHGSEGHRALGVGRRGTPQSGAGHRDKADSGGEGLTPPQSRGVRRCHV